MANTERTFTLAGTSIVDGRHTFRFTNGKVNLRVNMLKHKGHRAIKFVELPSPMTKVQAMAFLLKNGFKGVLPTRAANKRKKSPLQMEAEKLADKAAKISASHRARKEQNQTVPAVESVPVTETVAI